MDPLSTTASIIAVLQLTSKVTEYISAAVGATRERKKLREELRACEFILNRLKDDADDSEEGKAWSKTVMALQAPEAPLGRLTAALAELKRTLAPKKGLSGTWIRVMWPFNEKQVERIICLIEREKGLLSLALANDSRQLISHIQQSARENSRQLTRLLEAIQQSSDNNHVQVTELRDELRTTHNSLNEVNNGIGRLQNNQTCQEDNANRRAILDWLSSVDYFSRYIDMLDLRKAGTGQWFLDSLDYRNWLNTAGMTLYCTGIPGSGKTILSAILINDLTIRFSGINSTAIAYIYCELQRQEYQTPKSILRSILKQLSQSLQALPEPLTTLYKRFQTQGIGLSYTEISKTLRFVASLFSRVFIIFDALDECLPSHRKILAAELLKLTKLCGVNLLVTSRPNLDVEDQFQDAATLEITAKEEDVRKFLDDEIVRLPGFVLCNQELLLDVKESIIQSVQGMFLLAHLHLHSFVDKISVKAVRVALSQLATGSKAYDQVYGDAMERIKSKYSPNKVLACKVLAWIACAKRPLSTVELQHALAVEAQTHVFDKDNLSPVEILVSNCVGLLKIDDESSIVRLVHVTAQEYLERTIHMWFPDAKEQIAVTCLTYLQFDSFKTGICQKWEKLNERLRSNPFYRYAAQHWGDHAREAAGTPLQQPILDFVSRDGNMQASAQLLLPTCASIPPKTYKIVKSTGMTGLHLMSYFRLEEVFIALLPGYTKPDKKDISGRTPLSWAAQNGCRTIVQLLLGRGDVDVNSRDNAGRTPLSWAAEAGMALIVDLLLGVGKASADSQDDAGRTPLSYAAGKGHETVACRLLTERINVNSRYHLFGLESTSILCAIRIHGQEAMQVLFDTASKAIMAFAANSEPVVPGQFDHVLDIISGLSRSDYEAIRCRTSQLVSHPALGTVELVLLGEAHEPGTYGKTPLHLAASHGHANMVKMLLGVKGIVPDTRDEYHKSPLLSAAAAGHEEIVKMLLSTDGVSAESVDADGQTALSLAIRNKHGSIVRLLTDQSQSIKDRSTVRPVYRAATA